MHNIFHLTYMQLMSDQIRSFTSETEDLISRSQQSTTEVQLNDILMELEIALCTAEHLLQAIVFDHFQYPLQEVQEIVRELNQSQLQMRNQLFSLHSQTCSVTARNVTGNLTRQVYSELPGRPLLDVNLDQVELLRDAGYTWQDIADSLHISRQTLWRRLRERNVDTRRYTNISDHTLDRIISGIQVEHPHIGHSLMQGYLLGIGIHVQRYRLRASLTRMDNMQRSLRWHQRLTRREYRVPGPNALWHIDGHHSLIRWRFVIHGGIDGFSRYIVFIHCSTNNRARTVFNLFREATTQCGVPSRVRSDRGGENVMVCAYMVATRGISRGSHLAGSSHHNQRIERLWRDVFRCVASTFYSVFHFMESHQILDPCSDTDLFVLHSVFLPRINSQLNAFCDAWNAHPMRTERNWSPYRMWINGVLRPSRQTQTAVRDIVYGIPPEGINNFGIDYYGPLPYDEVVDQVDVPETEIPLNESQLNEFLEIVHRIPSNNYGIDVFVQAREILNQYLQ